MPFELAEFGLAELELVELAVAGTMTAASTPLMLLVLDPVVLISSLSKNGRSRLSNLCCLLLGMKFCFRYGDGRLHFPGFENHRPLMQDTETVGFEQVFVVV